jgi:ABC-type branched-subunit amino acid transport system ATPase component
LQADVRDDNPHLRVEGITAGYGAGPIINDVSLAVHRGKIVTVIGPNGSGKSTMLKAILGIVNCSAGRVLIDDRDITNIRTDVIARSGIGYVPQVRPIFSRLTVRENLEIGGYTLPRDEVEERIGEVLEVFPALSKIMRRRAGNLSGGEGKMLGIGRVLMVRPSLVVLDEPTADLAPRLAKELLQDHVSRLASLGAAVLMVEQRAADALAIASWAYVMRAGSVAVSQAAPELRERDDIGQMLLGVVS